MIRPSRPRPRGSWPIAARSSRRDAARNELVDAAERADDAERCVLRADQVADAVDDELQHALDRQQAGDTAHGPVESSQLVLPEGGLLLRPGGADGQLEGARQPVCVVARRRRPTRSLCRDWRQMCRERRRGLDIRPRLVTEQRAGRQAECRQRRGIERQKGAIAPYASASPAKPSPTRRGLMRWIEAPHFELGQQLVDRQQRLVGHGHSDKSLAALPADRPE